MYKRFKHIVIENSHEAPSDDEISAIEKQLNAKLPNDFLNFLDVANGGQLVDYYINIPLSPRPEAIGFNHIFTTKKRGYGSFLFELELHRSPETIFNIPDQVLPFADDGNGTCYLYLDLRDNKQSVVAFIYGLPEWTGLHQHDTLTKIADSFTEYVQLLEFDAEYNRQLLVQAIEQKNKTAIAAIVDLLELALPNWREKFGIDYDDGNPKQQKLWD